MYMGQRSVNLYDPLDVKSLQSGIGGSYGMKIGAEMSKAHGALDAQDAQGRAEHARMQANEQAQVQHERSLQQAEQQRRMYDSQTARDAQTKKYSVLGGLLGGGMGGMGGSRRQFGDIPASQRRA